MKRKILPVAIVSLLMGIAFDVLFYDKIPGISVFLFALLAISFTLLLGDRFGMRLSTSAYALMPVVLFFSFMVFVRASEPLLLFNIVLCIYLLLLVVKLCRNPDRQLTAYPFAGFFAGLPRLPLVFLQEGYTELRNLGRHRSSETASSYRPVIRGILLSLPLLLVFLLLFSSADAVFKQRVGSLFDISLNAELVVRLGLVLLVTTAFVGAYALLFMRAPLDTPNATPARKSDLGITESTIILGSVAVLFSVFVLFQLTYFFGGDNRVLGSGLTYAEYARKGFFELIAVAVIAMLVIFGLKNSTELKSSKQSQLFNWLSIVLVVEVMVIMLSAHMRLGLYEQAYGFTILRLFSHLFIGWLVVAFVLLLVYLIRREQESTLAFRLFVTVLGFFAFLNLLNPDAVIAQQNIDRYHQTGKLDASYLMSLSEDAAPALSKLLQDAEVTTKYGVDSSLFAWRQQIRCEYDDWQSANLARQQAEKVLTSREVFLKSPAPGTNDCTE